MKVGAALTDASVTGDPLGYLAGVRMSTAQTATVLDLLPGRALADGAPANIVSLSTVEATWHKDKVGRLVRRAVRTGDRPSLAVCAALLSAVSRGAPDTTPLTFGLSETFMGPRKASATQRGADRVLSAAYAISALSHTGLHLGSTTWKGAPPDWRFRAAPWILPILDTDTSPALVDLLTAARGRRLTFVSPGESPFMAKDNLQVAEEARNRAVGNAANLTRWTDWPTWFSHGPGDVQVMLTQDEEYAYAWVGRDGRGQLVAFDTTDFTAWGLDEPGMSQALAYAIGWYIDVSVSLRRNPAGTTSVRRLAGGSQKTGISYRPTPSYRGQRSGVAKGTHLPPTPHMRAAHVRDLGDRHPSEEALTHAPLRYRRQMGPHQTWVSSALVGDATTHKEMEVHLSKHSALAYVLGLMDK